ncbi:MAG: hypothetical protein ACD_79C01138G0003 [uncultured bacterium]|nr:MAG: hypothetical protein ACD_79C01138G0003 [uncultured bacterium]
MNTSEFSEYEISEKIKDICYNARKAWFELSNLSREKKDNILRKLALQLKTDATMIFASNNTDIEKAREAGLSAALIDRLTLNQKQLDSLIESLTQVINLPDPVGITLEKNIRPNGLEVTKISVPIGVIALIFESRPNVTIEASALAIKSGNSIILKGGKEAYHTNSALSNSIAQALEKSGISKDAVTLIPFKERNATLELLKQKETVDLVIPRGGESLINFVTENSLIPVIKHYKGLCHTYIDKDADVKKAITISVNAKVQRPGVCNAMETLLVHSDIADYIMSELISKFKENNVILKGCEKTLEYDNSLVAATEEDWNTEYLDKILSIKIVDSLEEAIAHIEKYGSRHSEAIITENKITASKFIQNIDASAVFVNASTRFNDGFELGLGAELGISTDKLHARGPMGLREMTTYKYVILGNGHIRE